MDKLNEDIIRILVAVLVGALIGAEREFRDKAAGLRTMTLICLGSALFTMFSSKLGGPNEAARIASNIVVGVGFLGAGSIVRNNGRVFGLTTASTVWLSAALGMGVGAGYYELVAVTTVISLMVLRWFPLVEPHLSRKYELRVYQIVCANDVDRIDELAAMVAACKMEVNHRQQRKASETEMICVFEVEGREDYHEKFTRHLLADSTIKSVTF